MTEIKQTTILEGSPTIYFLKGLPASGKSTWAASFMSAHPNIVRINKDLIRGMLSAKDFDRAENVTKEISRSSGTYALRGGFDVIVDDTNLASKNLNFWKALAGQHKYGLIEVFFDTPVDECIERDSKRTDSVGSAIISSMYNTFLEYQSRYKEYVYQDPSLPHAVIVDIDGTLAYANDRGQFDLSKVGTDTPNLPVIGLIRTLYHSGKAIIITSGRKASCLLDTSEWINKHVGSIPYLLLMRMPNDERKDHIVKQELYNKYIKDKYYVDFVLDDRNSVVDMWRKDLRLPCFQVNYGDF